MPFLYSKNLGFASLALMSVVITLGLITQTANPLTVQALGLSSQTDKTAYCLREPVTLQGTFTQDGDPVTDGLIAVEIRDPRDQHFAFRTISIGNPEEFWSVSITNVYITDTANNPITAAKIDTTIKLSISIKNNLANQIDVALAYTLYENTLIPIRSSLRSIQLSPAGTATLTGNIYIPEWATPGKALISVSAYNKSPSLGGIPYTPEELTYIYITRNHQLPHPYSPPPNSHQTQPGEYQIFFRMSPDRFAQPGTYNTHVVARTTPAFKTSSTTTFNMETESSPPQAAFTYYPAELYANMTATFDASSSSAEGFNDTIIRYEWFFNDPNNPQHVINEGNYTHPPNPLATHTFEYGGSYTVSLNVTDNEGLWSYTLKPVPVYPEYDPTADFTWTPTQPKANRTTTFNATNSQPGWSAKIADYSPIVNYTWNFGDDTGNTTTPDPTITHTYTQAGNYTVTLTIIDSVDRTDTTSKLVEVQDAPACPWDVNGDGYVGVDDIVLVAEHFGTEPGHPDWDPVYDVNDDDYVGIDDIVEVAENFGLEC